MRRVAIFDLDGTLIDSAPAIARALDRLRATRGLPGLDVDLVRRWVSLGAPALVGRALGCEGDADADEIAAFRASYAERPGVPGDLYPGIADALAALRDAGVALGICTNKPQALSEKVLAAAGIEAHFVAVIGGDATPRPKPDGAHLRHALDAMDCSGLRFDFVGDSSIDADAAHAAGARFLWAAWGYADTGGLARRGHTVPTPAALPATILQREET